MHSESDIINSSSIDLTIGLVIYDEIDQIKFILSQLQIEINHHITNRNIHWLFVLNHPDTFFRQLALTEIKQIIQFFNYFENSNNNLGLARNIILHKAPTNLIYYTDPDIEQNPQTLSKLLKLAELSQTNEKIIGFTGPVIHKSNSKNMNEMFHILQKISKNIPFSFQIQNHAYLNTVDHAPTCHLLLLKNRALNISGFSEEISSVGEDLDFSHRAYGFNFRFLFLPEATVVHHQNMSFQKWLSKMIKFGRVQIMVHKKNKHLPIRIYRLFPVFLLFTVFIFLKIPILLLILCVGFIYFIKPSILSLILTILSYSLGELFEILWPMLKLKNECMPNNETTNREFSIFDSRQ